VCPGFPIIKLAHSGEGREISIGVPRLAREVYIKRNKISSGFSGSGQESYISNEGGRARRSNTLLGSIAAVLDLGWRIWREVHSEPAELVTDWIFNGVIRLCHGPHD
jgi:hypothetical protein